MDKLPESISSNLWSFLENSFASSDLLEFWAMPDYGVFVTRSEKFYKQLKFNKGAPKSYYDGCNVESPSAVSDSRRLVSLLYEHLEEIVCRPTIIDVGGYIGRFSIESAKYLQWRDYEGEAIYCFEPGLTRPMITANLIVNHVEDKVKLYPYAISNEVGDKKFYLKEDVLISGSLAQNQNCDLSLNVRSIPLAHFLRNAGISSPLVVKIDTEGFEASVIDGLHGYQQLPNCVFIIEFWSGYLNQEMKNGKTFLEFVHNQYHVFDIRSSLYPKFVDEVADLKLFARNFDYSKGNVDLLLLPKYLPEIQDLISKVRCSLP